MMRKTVEENCNVNLRKMLEESSFIGHVDKDRFILQSGTTMFLCNSRNLRKEVFYQILLWEFENFSALELEEPLPVYDLAMIGLESCRSGWTEEDGPREQLAGRITNILSEKAQILKEYYGLVVNTETKCLESLPLLLENHLPPISGLANYILRITTEVDWDDEMAFFETFSRETADFYAEVPLTMTEEEWQQQQEHVYYPIFKSHLQPPNSFGQDKTFLELAALSNLYKVFERC